MVTQWQCHVAKALYASWDFGFVPRGNNTHHHQEQIKQIPESSQKAVAAAMGPALTNCTVDVSLQIWLVK